MTDAVVFVLIVLPSLAVGSERLTKYGFHANCKRGWEREKLAEKGRQP